jgi:hypothetical protein
MEELRKLKKKYMTSSRSPQLAYSVKVNGDECRKSRRVSVETVRFYTCTNVCRFLCIIKGWMSEETGGEREVQMPPIEMS